MTARGNTHESAADVLIGWATTSITPDRPVQLQGQHHERISKGVRDEIVATAMAIGTDDAAGSVIVSCDLTNLSSELITSVREMIGDSVPGLDPDRVVFAATHTHTAPVIADGFYPEPPAGVMTPEEYRALFADRVTKLVREACESRRAASLGAALGYAAVGFNRRTAYTDGTSRMYGDSSRPDFAGLEGGHDHGVELLYGFDSHGVLTGVVVNLACPSQVVESTTRISGDFWSSVRRRVRERYGEDVHILPLCSAAGDQSPRDLVRRGRRDADFRTDDGLEEMGRRIVACIDDRFEAAQKAATDTVELAHETRVIELPGRRITDSEAASITRERDELLALDPDPSSAEGGKLRKAERALERYRSQQHTVVFPAEVHVLRVGDVVLATNPFELFLDYGLRIKARSPAVQTFVVQLSGARGLYLPTRRAVESGHYGTIPTESFVGPEGGEMLVEETLTMINQVFRV